MADRIPRSYLFVPGSAADKLAKAPRRGADALIADLEDAVAATAKPAARDLVRQLLATPTDHRWWVRVNPPPLLADDLAAVVQPGLIGIVAPKADPALLATLDTQLTAAERRTHRPERSIPVIAQIESAAGVLAAGEVARGPRVIRLGIGEADLIGELGLAPDPVRADLTPLRLQVVLASAAAGLHPPVGPVETDLADLDRLRDSTHTLRALGFRGRTALHPRQLPVINEVFTPSPAEVAQARAVLAALEGAEAAGAGVAVDEHGRFIDLAVARTARETLLRHNGSGEDCPSA